MPNIEGLIRDLDAVVVFRHVAECPVLRAFRALGGDCGDGSPTALYSGFVTELFRTHYNFSNFLLDAVAEDENRYVNLRSRGEEVPEVLRTCVEEELKLFQQLSDLTAEELQKYVHQRDVIRRTGFLPSFETTKRDFAGAYEHEKEQLLANTRALLDGKPAANTLLYGAAGTGKSSSVKAVTNELAGEGLRLLELKKSQLHDIPKVMEELRNNPLKFIIFVDDLSFQKDDDNFATLKAILEGSASVKAPNTVIYATSNRRHLIRESFADREGDDIHRNDTIQETMSLSSRFGLTILFNKPAKPQFLEIVRSLAEAKGIDMDPEELEKQASAFAIRKGGATPRAAEQFTNSLLAK